MAAQEAPEAIPAPPESSMLVERFQRILGTAGMKPASGAEQRAEQQPIRSNQKDQCLAHSTPSRRRVTSRRTAGCSSRPNCRVCATSRSLDARRIRTERKTSRTSRRVEFRRTDNRSTRFGTRTASRAGPLCSPLGKLRRLNQRPRALWPCRATRSMSGPRFSRAARGNRFDAFRRTDAHDPWRGGH